MKILLVSPSSLDQQGERRPPARDITCGLTLPYLAALIGDRHQVRIIDDNIEPCHPRTPADAVLFTSMTSKVERAYQLAAQFRDRGVKTVLGGVHASLLTDEAAGHVDAVAVGEAETIVPELMADLEAGALKPRYQGQATELVGLPTPRYDLVKFENYLLPMYPVQVVRGCPNHCRYCTVTEIYGSRYRYRPIADVLRDLEAAGPFVQFIDDNLMADRERALELFRAMKGMGKSFLAEGTLALGKDEELLRAARAAGLMLLYTGVETLNSKGLAKMHKRVGDIGECIDLLRRGGVNVLASIIVGLEGDGDENMEAMVSLLEQHKTPFMMLYILTPPPGSRWYRELVEEGKLQDAKWRDYDGNTAVIAPPGLTREQLKDLYWRTYRRFYSVRGISRRLLWPPRPTSVLLNLMIGSNFSRGLTPFLGAPVGSSWDLVAKVPRAMMFLQTTFLSRFKK